MKKLFKCSVCNFISEGEDAPEICPKCGMPKEKFSELSKDDAQKVYMSDRTNDIHMTMIHMMQKMIALCEEGIKLTLDPPCVACFEKAKKEAWVIKQRAKAELEGHVSKGKW